MFKIYQRKTRKQRRIRYKELLKKFRSDQLLLEITNLLETGSSRISKEPVEKKQYYLSFLGDVASTVHSAWPEKRVLDNSPIAYFALKCWYCELFWDLGNNQRIEKDKYYEEIFKIFLKP